ncbi:MAG: SDR family NAD(P)-dependent oxidoreductase [Candidatus Asgardarchaeia archaeon]
MFYIYKISGGFNIPEADFKTLSDMISFNGKRVLITGAAAGIGKATAFRFAEAGATLQLVDINYEGLEKVKREINEKYNVEVDIYKVDLSKKSEIDALWDRLEGKEPDVLVNNAGIYPFKDFLKVDEEFLRKVIDINWTAVFWMCQHMIRRRLNKGGVIINIGTVEAILPFEEDLPHYTLSKAAVLALTRNLAKKYGKKGFRINAIIPGGIITPGFKDVAKNILKLKIDLIKTGVEFKWRLPIGRFGKPDEVARMILVLASDLASYVHGALIPVDGGFLSA